VFQTSFLGCITLWHKTYRPMRNSTKIRWCRIGQWRSQGGGQSGQSPPVGLDSDKNTVGSVVHAAELNWKWNFFFLREVFCGLEYAKMRLRPGLCPGPDWGSSRRSTRPPSQLGRGHPSQTPPQSRLDRSGLPPVDIISGYASGIGYYMK